MRACAGDDQITACNQISPGLAAPDRNRYPQVHRDAENLTSGVVDVFAHQRAAPWCPRGRGGRSHATGPFERGKGRQGQPVGFTGPGT